MDDNVKKKKTNFVKEDEREGEDPDCYLNMIPPGYRFCPTDEELIVYYLIPKNLKQILPLNKFRVARIWSYHPQDLIARFNFHREKEWYFFVERDDWYPKGSGPNRKAGFDGKWKQTGNDKEIYCHDQKIGYKTELVFIKQGLFFGGGVGQRTNWIMHEYKVEKETSAAADGIKDVPTSSTAAHHIKFNDWFLCKITTTEEIENNRQQQEELQTAYLYMGSDNLSHAYKEDDLNIPFDYLNSFPPGYRFRPTDEELIVHYLRPKILGGDLCVNKIHSVDVYDYSPIELTDMYREEGEEKCYFFSSRKLVKYGARERVKRVAGNGRWKPLPKDKPIHMGDCQIGWKRTLAFLIRGLTKNIKTDWRMTEYKEDLMDPLALCVIHNEPPGTVKDNRKRKGMKCLSL